MAEAWKKDLYAQPPVRMVSLNDTLDTSQKMEMDFQWPPSKRDGFMEPFSQDSCSSENSNITVLVPDGDIDNIKLHETDQPAPLILIQEEDKIWCKQCKVDTCELPSHICPNCLRIISWMEGEKEMIQNEDESVVKNETNS